MKPSVDILILNLNETDVVLNSIRKLRKEGYNVVVVDNGSDDDQKEPLYKVDGITLVDLPANNGSSCGRNAGLDHCSSDYVFLLDGDILYIPRTIENILKDYPPTAACVGVHNRVYWNGTQQEDEADIIWPLKPGSLSDDFEMAWTQYGLFKGDFIRKTKFYDKGVYGVAGVGFEDDWLYQDILKAGLKSYYYPNVLYYHEAHGGRRYLEEKGLPVNDFERLDEFIKFWGLDPRGLKKGQNQTEKRLT